MKKYICLDCTKFHICKVEVHPTSPAKPIFCVLTGEKQVWQRVQKEPVTIEDVEVPEGFLLIKSDSFLAKLNKIAPCETCSGSGRTLGPDSASYVIGSPQALIPCPDCEKKPIDK